MGVRVSNFVAWGAGLIKINTYTNVTHVFKHSVINKQQMSLRKLRSSNNESIDHFKKKRKKVHEYVLGL